MKFSGSGERQNLCTNANHLNSYIMGEGYNCETCGIVHGLVICPVCAETCHKGHILRRCGVSSSYFCDCAAYAGKRSCICCEKKQMCSRVVYSRMLFMKQHVFKCMTCGGKLICNACNERCHEGHEVLDLGIKKFECQCFQSGNC